MKKKALTILLTNIICCLMHTQALMAQRHLFKRAEIGFSNLWTDVAGITLATTVNTIVGQSLVDGQMRFGWTESDGNLKNFEGTIDADTHYDSYGQAIDPSDEFYRADARHLFNHIMAGAKIGYLSDRRGFFNYCAFASLHYNLRQLKQEHENVSHNIQRLQAGGGLMLIMGSIEKDIRYIIEGGVRYNLPLYYNNNSEGCGDKSLLNAGLSSHYQVKVSLGSSIAFGLQFDCMHYNFFKDYSIAGEKNKEYETAFVITLIL